MLTKLKEAIEKDSLITIKKMLEEGVNPNLEIDEKPLLVFAINQKASMEIIELLIEYGADINYIDEEGVGILDEAISNRNLELVKLLASKEVDLNETKRNSGFTPLMSASCLGFIDIVKFLLQSGVDISKKDRNNLNALEYAIKTDNKRVVELLKTV